MNEGRIAEPTHDDFEEDLHTPQDPAQHAGGIKPRMRTAHEINELHSHPLLNGVEDDAPRRILVLEEGERLKQGAVYFDLSDTERGEFTAMGDMTAERGHYYVPKTQVDYFTWNRLTGVEDAERTAGDTAREK